MFTETAGWCINNFLDPDVSNHYQPGINPIHLTASSNLQQVEDHIINSIPEGLSRRVDVYWLIHAELDDDPCTTDYRIDIQEQEDVLRVTFQPGFRMKTFMLPSLLEIV